MRMWREARLRAWRPGQNTPVFPPLDAPRLSVWKGDGRWRWYVANHPSPRLGDRTTIDGHATHAEALAVGLAALEAATVRLAQ